MPEFTVKEVRLPELHLPEIKRDDIVRALSGVRLPEVDLAKARRSTLKVPAVTITGADIDRLIAAGTALTRFAQPAPSRLDVPWRMFGRRRPRSRMALISRPQRPRWRRPILIGALIVLVFAAWSVLRRPETQRRLEAASRDARERFETWRAQDMRPDETPSSAAAEMATDVEGIASPTDDADEPADASVDSVMAQTGETDGVPAFEEGQSPR
jgi:hypothetical protein